MAAGSLIIASPASAANFDCFEWVRASTAHLIHPHHVHHAHVAVVTPRKSPTHVHAGPRIHHIATPLMRRPVACPEHEAVLYSPIPGAPLRETPEMLEAALAGPPAATQTGQDASAVGPAPPEASAPEFFPPEGGVPFGPPGELFPGPGPLAGLPAPPPESVLPVTPPDTVVPVIPPPGETPPSIIGPGVIPPGVISVPIVAPPGQPGVGPGPGPVGGVPEPATWGLMLLGFSGLGAALRHRRRAAAAG